MAGEYSISGKLSEKDIKRLTSLTRGSVVGPTATYYAGVTAPIISAAVAIFSKTAFVAAGLPNWWVFFLSTSMAALSGIAWYLIFMRWSYRHTFGRGSELTDPTTFAAGPEGVSVTRGPIETRIGWDAVDEVHVRNSYVAVVSTGADAMVIPNRWFGKDKAARQAFLDVLSARGDM
ncbi:MAG: YcxB family protein [Pseudomonadota bacterium]